MVYNNKNNYLIGDDMVKHSGGFYRNMCEPTKDGESIDTNISLINQLIDCRSTSSSINQSINTQIMTRTHSDSIGQSIDNINDYVDSMDVHHSSGIYNKAWCLLSKTPGWDYIKAFQVSLRLSPPSSAH